jgi:hypothetical protein
MKQKANRTTQHSDLPGSTALRCRAQVVKAPPPNSPDWPCQRVQKHVIEGVSVRIYGPAKTVVDCFRYRNKIGLDVALEALRDCHRRQLATLDELWEYAKLLRVAAVMRPYLESLV